jgi:hypothetical protein
MKIKNVVFEDFVNYKEPSMFIIFPYCSFKCDIENGSVICQNRALATAPIIEVDKENLCEAYFSNPITKAVVLGGLEPFDSEIDLISFIDTFRREYNCEDPIIIYTGYTEEELENGNFGRGAQETQKKYYHVLKEYKNIIIKFGRFIPNQDSHFDKVLGVKLASPNQYARVISNEN